MKKLYDEVDWLSSLPMFKPWTFNAVKHLHYSLNIVKFKRGQVVYSQGDPSPAMFIVRNGEFKVDLLISVGNNDGIDDERDRS